MSERDDDMERRVAERTAALAEANARLVQADRRKDEFLALLSHELRNPLAALAAAIPLLRVQGQGNSDLEQSCEVIERQITYLTRLVDDLLDVSRMLRGKIQLSPERVELGTVIARAVETSQPLLKARGHELTVAVPAQALPLHADVTRLAQVFANLLNNA